MKKETPKVPFLKQLIGSVVILFSLTSAFAQDRMTPTKAALASSMEYQIQVFKFFDVYSSRNFDFVAMPSFSAEYNLSYDCKTKSLVLKKASENIYSSRWVSKTTYSLKVSDSLIDALRAMVTAVVLTATFTGDTTSGFDGTAYCFIIQPHGQIAECWSPKNGTNNAKTVSVMEKLCEAVKHGNRSDADNLTDEISQITNIYRQYYPKEFHSENAFINTCP